MFHNSFLNLELLITFFLQLFVARTLVPDNASYDNQCHRRHQHQTVVNISGVLNRFVVQYIETKQCTRTKQFAEESHDYQNLGISQTITDTVKERLPRSEEHTSELQSHA